MFQVASLTSSIKPRLHEKALKKIKNCEFSSFSNVLLIYLVLILFFYQINTIKSIYFSDLRDERYLKKQT
jgi:hypothetical protein